MQLIEKITSSKIKMFLFFAVLISVVYCITFDNPFFLDDSHTIVSNSAIHLPENFFKLWTSAKYYSSSPDNFGYRPVTTFTNSVMWMAADGATWPFHVFKKLLHAVVCLLLFLIWSRIFSDRRITGFEIKEPKTWAFLISALFAIHPANSQIVNYISATSTILAGVFFLLGFYTYLKFRENDKNKYLAIMFVLYVLSILSKEEGVTLPVVILFYEALCWLRGDQFAFKRVFKIIGVYALGAAVSVGLLMHMFEPTSDIARGTLGRWVYFMTQWRAWLRYMRMVLLPYDLNADNLEFGFSLEFWDAKVLTALLINLFFIFWSLIKLRKTALWALGFAWFYVAISPASSVVVLAEPVNDHRMYLAYFGFFPMVFYFVGNILQNSFKKKNLMIVCALIFVGYSGWTFQRNFEWQTNKDIWTDTVQKNPSSGRALNNLALEYMTLADWVSSLKMLSKCLDLFPCYMQCWVNKAIVLSQMGHEDEAVGAYKQSIACDMIGVDSRSYLADHLAKRGRYGESLQYYEEAAKLSFKRNMHVMLSYINTLIALGKYTEAKDNIRILNEQFPNHPYVKPLVERYL